MEICFQSTTSTINFENWLKSFLEISKSVLIEIDTHSQQFIAKTHTTNRNIVKYGCISFEDAGFEVLHLTGKDRKKVALDEWNASNTDRIMIGVKEVLDKFVKVVDQFSDTDNHKFIVKFDATTIHLNNEDRDMSIFEAQKVEFKSRTLDMVAKTSDIEESFVYISDEKFNAICDIANPVVFTHSTDVSKSLVNISNIFSADVKKDIIDFRIQKDGNDWTLHAVDFNAQSYDYEIGYLSKNDMGDTELGDEIAEIHVPVIRQNYILGTKSDTNDGTITLSGIKVEGNTRIKVESGKDFITIISSVTV